MDGNRRWAKKNKLSVAAGHKAGAQNLEKIVQEATEQKVKFLTLYAFSTENWKRSEEEVKNLMDLLRQYIRQDIAQLVKKGVKIVFIGEKSMLDADIVAAIEDVERQTQKNDVITLIMALSYGSRTEIVNAAKKLSALVKRGDINLEDIDEKTFSDMLYTRNIPDPDLMIRTGGDKRVSNYLLWQLAYTEFFFTDTLWPDFSAEELRDIIKQFNKRERRYGAG